MFITARFYKVLQLAAYTLWLPELTQALKSEAAADEKFTPLYAE